MYTSNYDKTPFAGIIHQDPMRNRQIKTKPAVSKNVQSIIVHPEFNNRTLDNLVLLKLKLISSPIHYDTHFYDSFFRI